MKKGKVIAEKIEIPDSPLPGDVLEFKATFADPVEALLWRYGVAIQTSGDDGNAEKMQADWGYLRQHLRKLEFKQSDDDGRLVVRMETTKDHQVNVQRILSTPLVRAIMTEILRAKSMPPTRSAPHPPGPIRVAGHLVNQFNQDAEVKRQHELFREAGQAVDTKDPIHIFSELSVPERLLVSALSYLLQSTSSNIKTPGGIDYYMGNLPGERLPYNIGNKGEIQTATWPKITATWYEMAKAMGGGELSGGQSIRNVKKHLEKLAGKKHIVHQYKRTKDGSSIEVRTTSPLILIFERTSIRKEKGKVAESVTIGLSPIFRDQIGTYYLNRPGDYLQRLYQAHGGRKVPMATVSLIDYLSARLMHKESKHKIGVVKLREKLGLSATYKPGRILAEIERAITAGKAVGLIDACHQEQGVAGEILFCFDLNLKWGHSEKK